MSTTFDLAEAIEATVERGLEHGLLEVHPQHHFDEEDCFRLTAAGALALGLELDPTRRGPITAPSRELGCWVWFR